MKHGFFQLLQLVHETASMPITERAKHNRPTAEVIGVGFIASCRQLPVDTIAIRQLYALSVNARRQVSCISNTVVGHTLASRALLQQIYLIKNDCT
jgi:hypothetical protein